MWQVFSEAEIRASVVFQLSELVNTLLKASRTAIGGSEWDALVAGDAYIEDLHAFCWRMRHLSPCSAIR